jgi:hypothetical protein
VQLPLVGQPQSCALLNRATTALTLCVHSKAAQKPTNVFFFAKRTEFTVVSEIHAPRKPAIGGLQ